MRHIYARLALLIMVVLSSTPNSVCAQEASGNRIDGATVLSTPIASSIFGTAADCTISSATCLPTGLATINYTVNGTGNCTFLGQVNWGDGSLEAATWTVSHIFQHQYMSPGVYSASVTGNGTPNDANSTCTFNPFSAVYEVPAPSNPPPQFTKSALDAAAAIAKRVGPDWAKMFATYWSELQNAFKFATALNDLSKYPQQVLSVTDSLYENDPEWRNNLDTYCMSFCNGQPYGSLPKGQRIEVGKAVADQTGATGWLLEKARKAGKTGAQLVFQ